MPVTPAASHMSTASCADQYFEDLPDQEDATHDSDEDREDDEHGSLATQKLACDRCRHRKIRCNRVEPCSGCVRAKTPCAYPAAPKLREKRQRVLISTQYERKIDHISQKLDELTRSMSQLSHRQPQRLTSHPPIPSFNTPVSNPSPFAPIYVTDESEDDSVPNMEFEGESSMSAHAIFAAKFIQNAITNNPSIDVSMEMTSAIRNLHDIMDVSKNSNFDKMEKAFPNARKLASDESVRNLPLPPAEVVLPCLRMVSESPLVQMLWFWEFQTMGQFMEYFLKVYSPGPATDWELIIVHAGLHWLFVGCRLVVRDPEVKKQYLNFALSSRDNLETVLARLPFHTPLTKDCALATSVAACYCIQMCRPSVAWSFSVTASQTCLSLGLHSIIAMSHQPADTRQENLRLFWAVYMTDKLLSLRLGRSSTMRDSDITVPYLAAEEKADWSLNPVLPSWIKAAALHGRTFDEIYSPGALMQPQEVRVSRARALAAELTKITSSEQDFIKKYYEARLRVFGDGIHEIFWRLENIHVSSMLTLIYRAIPAEKPSDSSFCEECITTARKALEEHEICVALMVDNNTQPDILETFINWSLIESPSVPFIVLFCRIIETSDASDLKYLKALITGMERASSMQSYYSTGGKQLRIFSAMYDIARQYVGAKAASRENDTQGRANLELDSFLSVFGVPPGGGAAGQQPGVIATDLGGTVPVGLDTGLGFPNQFLPDTGSRGQVPYGLGMELDPESIQLGEWYQRSHEMLRFMESNPL